MLIHTPPFLLTIYTLRFNSVPLGFADGFPSQGYILLPKVKHCLRHFPRFLLKCKYFCHFVAPPPLPLRSNTVLAPFQIFFVPLPTVRNTPVITQGSPPHPRINENQLEKPHS